jgi:hypothetical protein
MAYLTRWRLQLGARALTATSRSVAQIASDVGYAGHSRSSRIRTIGGILRQCCPMNDGDERGHVDRFHKMFVEAGLATSDAIGRLSVACHRDESGYVAALADLARQLISIYHRETEVYYCDVCLEAFER